MQIHVVLPALVFTLLVAAAPLDEALHSRSSCAPVYVIFCRGTIEIPPLGTFVGPFFQAALVNLIPGVEVVGVTYPASIEGYLEGGDPIGTADMEALAEAYASDCPDGTIVLSGYSQGAQVTHNTLNALETAGSPVISQIGAVVTWGDPFHTETTYGIPFKYYCETGDLICDDLPIVDPYHLEYGLNGDAADGAAWVASIVQ